MLSKKNMYGIAERDIYSPPQPQKGFSKWRIPLETKTKGMTMKTIAVKFKDETESVLPVYVNETAIKGKVIYGFSKEEGSFRKIVGKEEFKTMVENAKVASTSPLS